MTDLETTTIGLGKYPALIVVDMINGFTDSSSPLGCQCDSVVEGNLALLTRFRDKNLPVFFTTTVYRQASEASVFRRKLPSLNMLKAGSLWVEIDARLTPVSGECVIEKLHASAFHGTELAHQLDSLEVDSLVVTGLTTSGCVRATAVDGLQENYPVVIPREAVGDRNPDAHTANLYDLNAKYADVTSLQQVLQCLDAFPVESGCE